MINACLVIVDGRGMEAETLIHPLFSDLRTKKILSHQTEKMKIDSACAELAYLCAFSTAFHENGKNLYSYKENKQPYFTCEKYGFLSLAHASAAGACLIAPVPCGVDIEQKDRDIGRIDRKIRFRKDPEKEDGLALWCAKESFVKLTGEGISRPFSSLCYHPGSILDENGKYLAWAETGQIKRMIWAAALETEVEIQRRYLTAQEALDALK